ncbi:MAG: hypothetical protein ACD_20C00234G0021 [uncultured bacterium]|nr:MAG: hypothetical protein ACD_20C00234G0021 [uncultured bacterium]HBH18777.1 hypothetical protein [Cyanobacteria bacterium UBA9579]
MRTFKEELKISLASTIGFIGLKGADLSLKLVSVNYNPQLSPVIYAVWHGAQLGLANVNPRKDTYLLISKSNDGEIITRVSTKLGYSAIRGSMGRGGTEALRTILRTLRVGKNVAYTVDGPRGPIYKVKSGIIKIAQMSQKPIVPLVPAGKRKIVANSWDKYQIPFFTKWVTVFGDPIYVPKDINDDEVEQYRLALENKLFELRDQAEEIVASGNYSYTEIKKELN